MDGAFADDFEATGGRDGEGSAGAQFGFVEAQGAGSEGSGGEGVGSVLRAFELPDPIGLDGEGGETFEFAEVEFRHDGAIFGAGAEGVVEDEGGGGVGV